MHIHNRLTWATLQLYSLELFNNSNYFSKFNSYTVNNYVCN